MDKYTTPLWQEMRAGWRFFDISQLGRARTPEGRHRMLRVCKEFSITKTRLVLVGYFTIIEVFALVVLFGLFINSQSFALALLYLVMAFPVSFILAPIMLAHTVGAARDENYELLRTLENVDMLRYQNKIFRE